MTRPNVNKIDIVLPHSRFYQGPFGRLCPDLPAWSPEEKADDFLLEFVNMHMIEVPNQTPAQALETEKDLSKKFGTGDDKKPLTGIPAGYTYFGQFVDHDITFDPTPLSDRRVDPNGLLNFRTPRLDLDNIYGRGPADQPYLYKHVNGTRTGEFLIGQVASDSNSQLRDLPRNPEGRALIGDMRNDENSIISQLQLAFLLAHNTLVDRAKKAGAADNDAAFSQAQQTLQWLYQWVVWNDFVARITTPDIHGQALRLEDRACARTGWELGFSDIYRWKNQPFMPLEFAGAAYRFGHSMVRNAYQINHPHRGFGEFVPIFDNSTGSTGDDLRGFRPATPENSIQWNWFLPMGSNELFPQRARQIDTKLANALTFLHEGATGDPQNILAFRNLKRGISYGLPSGPDMARKLSVDVIDLEQHEIGALWYYVLKEAELGGGERLGTLGSLIVCSTFAGILKGASTSFINLDPTWTPDKAPLLRPGHDNQDSDGAWELTSIIRLAGLPVDATDITTQSGES